jgi:hypothetical protein
LCQSIFVRSLSRERWKRRRGYCAQRGGTWEGNSGGHIDHKGSLARPNFARNEITFKFPVSPSRNERFTSHAIKLIEKMAALLCGVLIIPPRKSSLRSRRHEAKSMPVVDTIEDSPEVFTATCCPFLKPKQIYIRRSTAPSPELQSMQKSCLEAQVPEHQSERSQQPFSETVKMGQRS